MKVRYARHSSRTGLAAQPGAMVGSVAARAIASSTDVRCRPAESACGSANFADGADYTGQLQATAMLRLTDKQNGTAGNEPG